MDPLYLTECSASPDLTVSLRSKPFTKLAALRIIDLLYPKMLESYKMIVLSPCKDQMIDFEHSNPVLHCQQ